MDLVQMLPQLGVAGAIVAAVILLLREVKRPATSAKLDSLDQKIQNQQGQLDCLIKEQSKTRAIVAEQGGRLDTILEIIKRQ